jgi:hypothetical protein
MLCSSRMKNLWLVVVWLAGCSAVDYGRLPRVPIDPQVPRFPPALRGLTFRVRAVVETGAIDGATLNRTGEACIANFERWMSEAGWTPTHDPSTPVDLVIEEHCNACLSTKRSGNIVEIQHPADETIAIVVEHDGVPVITVPRGPADYVCESSGSAREIANDCMARSERWAQAHILQTLIDSDALTQLAKRIH